MRRESDLSMVRFFIPYLFTESIQFAVLRSFVFAYCEMNVLQEFLDKVKFKTEGKYIDLYCDRQRHAISIPNKMMQKFLLSCSQHRESIDFSTDIKKNLLNTKVILRHTAFKGEKAYVVGVDYTQSGVLLTLGLPLIKGALYLKINAKEGDIEYVHEQDKICDADNLIQQIQKKLLPILSRKVFKKDTKESIAEDISTLNTLSTYKYNSFENTDQRIHYLSLMLICAHLQKDSDWENMLLEKSMVELSSYTKETLTEPLCWLYIGLYVCTGNPEYRNMAKQYIQSRKSSEDLLAFTRLIRKRRI